MKLLDATVTSLPIMFTILCMYILGRSIRVYNYRSRVMTAMHNKNMADIDVYNFGTGQKRWEAFNAVNYNAMVFKIWRRIDSFFPDEFLKEIEL